MDTLELDKKLEDIEKNVRARRGDPPLVWRAGRILRIKIYLLLRGRERSPHKKILAKKIILPFIIVLFLLWAIQLFTGMAIFMATIILYILVIYALFSAINRLDEHYFKYP
jgi:hypothetical protein